MDGMPVRRFRWSRGLGHFPGWWWAATTGRHVGYESWLERDHVRALDFDPEITGIASQPFWLYWTGERGRRRLDRPESDRDSVLPDLAVWGGICVIYGNSWRPCSTR